MSPATKEEKKAEKQKAKKEKKDDKKKRRSVRGSDATEEPQSAGGKRKTFDNVYDIDPDDAEANKAATRIQASFRGHNTRRSLKQEHPTGTGGDAASPSKSQMEAEFDPSDKGGRGDKPRRGRRGEAATKEQGAGCDVHWSSGGLSDLEKVVVAAFGAALLSIFFYGLGDRST